MLGLPHRPGCQQCSRRPWGLEAVIPMSEAAAIGSIVPSTSHFYHNSSTGRVVVSVCFGMDASYAALHLACADESFCGVVPF